MRFRRRLGAVAAVGAILTAALAGGSASAAPRSATRTAVLFAERANLWRASWYSDPTAHYLARVEGGLVTARVHRITRRIQGLTPETDANITSYLPTGARIVRYGAGSDQRSYQVRVAIDARSSYGVFRFSETDRVDVTRVGGVWLASGAYIPGATGPAQWCPATDAASAYCEF